MSLSIFNLVYLACVSVAFGSQDGEPVHTIKSAVLQIAETVDVPAKIAGPILRLDVKQGAVVTKNAILGQIDDGQAQIKLRESKLELEIVTEQANSNVEIEFANKSKKVLVSDLQRAEDSNRRYRGVVSDREMDRLKLQVEQSEAELEKIKFEKKLLNLRKKLRAATVDRNELELEQYKIRSSIAGQVVDVQKRVGEWVDVAEPVFKVVRLDRLQVEEYLPLRFANSKLLNCRAVFANAGKKMEGRVTFVDPRVNPLNSTVLVRIEFDNSNLKLRPGIRGEVTILNSTTAEFSLGTN